MLRSSRNYETVSAVGLVVTNPARGRPQRRLQSFFSTLKLEHTYRHRFAHHDEARLATFEWIEAFYNLRRRHSSIGYLSPVDFENQTN